MTVQKAMELAFKRSWDHTSNMSLITEWGRKESDMTDMSCMSDMTCSIFNNSSIFNMGYHKD